MALTHPKSICEKSVVVKGTDLITFIRREQRESLNNDSRWQLFDKNSPEKVTVGSILKVTYFSSKSEMSRPSTFTGVLIAVRRHAADPTFILRTVVDNVGVEQLFLIFNPLITKIEVVRRAIKCKSYKAYWLREKPEKAAEFITKARSKK